MLTCANDAFIFLKTAKKCKQHVHHVHYSSRTSRSILCMLQCLQLTRDMNVKEAVEIYFKLSKILKFKYW